MLVTTGHEPCKKDEPIEIIGGFEGPPHELGPQQVPEEAIWRL